MMIMSFYNPTHYRVLNSRIIIQIKNISEQNFNLIYFETQYKIYEYLTFCLFPLKFLLELPLTYAFNVGDVQNFQLVLLSTNRFQSIIIDNLVQKGKKIVVTITFISKLNHQCLCSLVFLICLVCILLSSEWKRLVLLVLQVWMNITSNKVVIYIGTALQTLYYKNDGKLLIIWQNITSILGFQSFHILGAYLYLSLKNLKIFLPSLFVTMHNNT